MCLFDIGYGHRIEHYITEKQAKVSIDPPSVNRLCGRGLCFKGTGLKVPVEQLAHGYRVSG